LEENEEAKTPNPSSNNDEGSATVVALPVAANPVANAPLLVLAGEVVTKM
jgi:hypothetical protein